MRKVLSFVLVLTLVLGSFSMAFAAEPVTLSDVDGTDYEEAVRVLTNLGVITGYEDGTYKPDQVVTRAEATLIVIKALGLANSVGTQTSSYPDLGGYGWAQGYIAFGTQLGLVTGYPDGTFKPGQSVSYNEFATIVIRALGYTDDSLTGTWPAKYVNQAAAVGIMDDIASGGSTGANRGDVAIMANNAITAYIGSVDKDNNWIPIIKSGSEARGNAVYDTMVGRLGGYFAEGVISDNATSTFNIKPYVAKYAEYYTDKADGKGDIIAIAKVKSESLTGSFDVDEEDEDNNTWEKAQTFEGNDDVDYKLAADMIDADSRLERDATVFFRNGEEVSDYIVPSDITDLEVELSGKSIRTLYSVSAWIVESDAHGKIESADLDDIADGELFGYEFDLNRNDEIIDNSFELVGVDSLDDIKVDNIVYVYGDDDDVIKRVAVGTEVVEGEISKINSSGSKWTIDGKTYEFAKVSDVDTETFDAGDEVELLLDAYGKIYDVEAISGSANDYAVVLDKGTFNQVKLYLATDSTKIFDTDLAKESTLPAIGTLIGYGLDKDGVIDTISPKNAEDENARFEFAAEGAFLASNRVLNNGGYTYSIKSDVTVFTVDDGDYDISKIADIDKGADKESVVGFLVKKEEVVAIIVDDKFASGTSDDSYAVISDLAAVTNPDGDRAYELTGFIDGKKMNNVYTASRSTTGEVDVATVSAYTVKYNDDGYLSRITRLSATTTSGIELLDGKVSNGYVTRVDGELLPFADNAQVYVVELDGTVVDEYKSFSGSFKEGTTAWLYDADKEEAGYEVIILLR